MEASLDGRCNAKDTAAGDDIRRRPGIASIILVLAVGAVCGLASVPDRDRTEVGIRPDSQAQACDDGQTRADCGGSGYMISDHAILERLSRMLPTQGV